MNPIKISIIMPVYNKAIYLKKAISSIVEQDFKEYEVILIDDGSTDGSNQILREIASEYSRINFYEQKNAGVSATRNRGINLAKGEYICFLDADDFYLGNFLSDMYKAVQGKNVAYCGNYNTKGEKLVKSNLTFKNGDILDKYLKNVCIPNTNSWIINLEFIKRNKLRFPTEFNLGEDMVFFSKILLLEKDVQAVPKYLSVYNSTVSNSLTYNIENLIDKDLEWMEYLKSVLLDSYDGTNYSRIRKVIKTLESYRMPASVIYKVALRKLSKELNNEIFQEYAYILKNKRIINGLRSIKLQIIYLKLKYFGR